MTRRAFDADEMVNRLIEIACELTYAHIGEKSGIQDLHEKIDEIFPKAMSRVTYSDLEKNDGERDV